MCARSLLLPALVGLVLPGTVLAQDDWSGSLVPYIGRPPLGSAYEAISDGHALQIGSVLGVAYDLGTPLRLVGLRAGASRTIGAEAVGTGSPSDGVFGSVGIDARFAPAPRGWWVRPYVAYGISAFYVSYEAGEEGSPEASVGTWHRGQTFGFGADIGTSRTAVRVELVSREYCAEGVSERLSQQGHFLLTAGLVLPVH
jgi:hypothetical protein